MQPVRTLHYFAKVENTSGVWVVQFPDLPRITASGKSFWDAMACAEASLNAALEADLERGNPLPTPTDFQGAMGYFPIQVRTSILQAFFRKGDP